MFATAACVAPSPPIVLRPPVASRPAAPRAKLAARVPRCEPAGQSALSSAEKARLFEDFDGWQGERRATGAVADAPLPPPAQVSSRSAASGCRITRN